MFLKDKPSGVDLFQSKSHEKIANSIMTIIEGKNDDHDIIGLEGGWGSGKSNIIEIMKIQMKDTHSFFIYNAWGHQEDLQRRAFLEELTEELNTSELLKKPCKWKKDLNSLLSRKIRSTTKTIPSFSKGYLIIAFIIFLNSITRNYSPLLLDSIESEKWKLFFTILMENSPIVGSLLILIITITIISIFSKNTFFTKFNQCLDKVFALYKNKELENTVETITSTKDPTVKEFESWMIDLSSDLKKDLVIVFDNMDRLPPNKAKDLWSSIHTFFSESSYKGISVIVPFDRNQIRKIFDSNINDINNHEADRFIDKTFSLLYKVSPPVVSDWKQYFNCKFKEAELDGDELIEVRSLYDYKNKKILPREIIKFLNEISLFDSIWEHQIPLKYIAVYVLNKDSFDVENPAEVIVNSQYLKDTGNIFNSDVSKYLSAIVFNVPLDTAIQVLLDREIVDAVRNRDRDEFSRITKVKGFNFVFERYLGEIENIEDTIFIVYNTLYVSDKSSDITKRAIKTLTNMFFKMKLDEVRFKDYMGNLILMNKHDTIINLLNHILKSFGEINEIDGTKYFVSITEMEKFVEENKLKYNVRKNLVEVDLSIDEYYTFIDESMSNPQEFKVSTDMNEIVKDINYMIDNSNFDYLKIELLKYIDVSEEFIVVKNRIKKIFENNAINIQNLSAIFKLADIVMKTPIDYAWNFNNVYTNLVNNFNEEDESTHILAAMFIKHTYLSNATQSHINAVNQRIGRCDDDFIIKIVKHIKIFMNFGQILTTTIKPSINITSDIAKEVAKDSSNTIDVKEVFSNFDKIVNGLDEEGVYLISILEGWSRFIDKYINKENIFSVLETSKFLLAGNDTDYKIVEIIRNIYIEYYNQKNCEYFKALFDDTASAEFEILDLLIGSTKFNLTNSIIRAYKEYLILALNSGTIDRDTEDMLNKIYNLIDKRSMPSPICDVRDAIINKNKIISCDVNFYFPLLIKYGKLHTKADDATRTIVKPILNDGDLRNLLYEHKNEVLKIINSANEERLEIISILEELGDTELLPKINMEE